MNKRKKICFVSPFAYGIFFPESKLKFGGAEFQISKIASELSKNNFFNISLAILNNGQAWKEKKINGIRLIKAYKTGNFGSQLMGPIILMWKLFVESPDVVVCRANGAEVGIACFYSKFFRKKFIYSIACDIDARGDFFKGFRGRLFKFGIENADVVIAQNDFQKEDFINRYPKKKDNVYLIKNSISLDLEKDKNQKKDYVLWVGSSSSVKQPEVFIRLVKKNKDKHFLMIMTKSSSNFDLWEKIKKDSSSIDNLELIDFVDSKKIENLYKDAKVLVNTSKYEGFPNTFLQAGRYSTPILSLKVDPDNFIKNKECGFVCNSDFEQLNNKLQLLFNDKNVYERMSEKVFEYVKENHNIKDNILKWEEILKKI